MRILSFLLLALLPALCRAQIYYGETELSPMPVVGSAIGNIAGAYLTVGLSAARAERIVEGGAASVSISSTRRPVFHVRYSADNPDSLFQVPRRIERLLMLRLHPNKKRGATFRRLRVGRYGLIEGAQGGPSRRDIVRLDVEARNPYDILVRPHSPLSPGQYCFYYTGDDLTVAEVYDFSVE